jgi:hypothetical protein
MVADLPTQLNPTAKSLNHGEVWAVESMAKLGLCMLWLLLCEQWVMAKDCMLGHQNPG